MTIKLHPKKMIHIIAPTGMEHHLKKTIRAAGACGFTYYTVKGEGESGIQTGHLAGDSSTLFMVVTYEEKCNALLEQLKTFKDRGHHLTVFVSDTQVMDFDKF